MEINAKLQKQIDEVRYLTAENASRYRVIMRFFYLQYERMKYWLYKEDVFEELKKHSQFEDYTKEQLKQDLDNLVQWKNLIPVQDTSKVSSVEEFKNKQFRYQISDYSIEIERMIIKLETLHVETASLEPSLLERIKEAFIKIPQIINSDEKVANQWWKDLNSDFERLNKNYKDYLGSFYSLKAEEMMKTSAFLLYKDKFIEYLRNFIKELQQHIISIEGILKQINEHTENALLLKIFLHEKSIPKINNEATEEEIKENIESKWRNIKNWFLPSNAKESEATRLLDITNEIIRKITRYAAQISESRNSAANRKEEYKKLAQLFTTCKDINEAHKLSALCFGIFNPYHIKTNAPRSTESINSSPYDEIPSLYIIKPKIRNYKEKSERSPIKSNLEKKEITLQNILKSRQQEQELIQNYIKNGIIDFSNLPKIPQSIRISLLRWLSKGLNSPDFTSKTETGIKYKIVPPDLPNQKCTIVCDDGEFTMPAFKIIFRDGS